MEFINYGDMKFNVISVLGKDAEISYSYAEQPYISVLPGLQFTGKNLKNINLSVLFDHSFCNPEQELITLGKMAQAGKAYPLFYNSGRTLGNYVVERISYKNEQMMPDGKIIRMSLTLSLKLFEDKKNLKKNNGLAIKNKVNSDKIKTNINNVKKNKPTPAVKNNMELNSPIEIATRVPLVLSPEQISAIAAEVKRNGIYRIYNGY